jgi:hypothetical protein
MRKREVFKKPAALALFSGITPILLTIAVTAMVIFGLSQTEESSKSEGLRILDEGIRRAVISCYAMEGYYPESLAYIENNYGVTINRERYIVHYQVIASNIMPDITVWNIDE